MKLVLGADAEVAAWVAAHIPLMQGQAFGPNRAMAVMSDRDEMLGGVVFHNWQPAYRNIEVSFASTGPRWLTRDLIQAILSYPFDALRVQRLTAVTPRQARPARQFLEKFGFRREGLVRHGFGTDDAVISGLLEKEWRASPWSQSRKGALDHGQAFRADAA